MTKQGMAENYANGTALVDFTHSDNPS